MQVHNVGEMQCWKISMLALHQLIEIKMNALILKIPLTACFKFDYSKWHQLRKLPVTCMQLHAQISIFACVKRTNTHTNT